jgi:hypothetical protein
MLVEDSESHRRQDYAADMRILTGDPSWSVVDVSVLLKELGYSRVKVTTKAKEQSPILRQQYRDKIKHLGLFGFDLIFCDEMAMVRASGLPELH